MDHFDYKNGIYYAEDVAIPEIANAISTPFYCYSSATLQRHYQVFNAGLHGLNALVCFAVKANPNIGVLATLAAEGAGADVVSEGEIRAALAAGIPASHIVFSGVAKTKSEMAFALEQGIFQFNVESLAELNALNEVALSKQLRAPIAIRVNPDVDAETHAKISTGKKESKFGIAMAEANEVYAHAANLPGIAVQGISVHIGSQLTSLAPFKNAFQRVREFAAELRASGHAIRILDLGGGLGIPYGQEMPPLPEAYGDIVRECFNGMDFRFVFEPGRLLVGNAGILVTKVLYLKQSGERLFVMVDAGMNDLVRPAMYDAHHDIIPICQPAADAAAMPVDIVGPVCESSDIFAANRLVKIPSEGDLLAFRSAGAYGASMSSTYNSRPLVAEVLVRGKEYTVVRPRQTYDELLSLTKKPNWLR